MSSAIGEEGYRILCESRKQVKQRKRLDEVIIETGVSQEDYELIKTGSRKRVLTKYKLKYITIGIENGYTMGEIGQNIGMTAAAVKDMMNRYGK